MTPDGDEYWRELEERAEQLGLPTDPEAYQDGGMAVAVTASNLAEAETLAALLRGHSVPAWVNAPLGTLVIAEPVFTVMVPLGRLADAHRVIAEHPHHESPPEESPDASEEAAQAPPAAAVLPAEPAAPTPRRNKARLAASLIILGFGIMEVLLAVLMPISVFVPVSFEQIVCASLAGTVGVAACVIGIIGLRASLTTAGQGDRGTRAAEPTTEEPEAAAEPTEEWVVRPSPRAPSPSLVLMVLGLVVLLVGLGAVAYAVTGFILFLILVYFDPMEAARLVVSGIAGIATCPFGVRLWRRGRRGRRLGAGDHSAGG
jgi:hypothetical protein